MKTHLLTSLWTRLIYHRRGFSLVETLMATGIISTAALGTLGLLAGSMNSSVDGIQRSRAVVMAQDIFHDLQIGALNLAPAATDERQSRMLRPEMGFGFTKHVLLFDSAGALLPASSQPKANDSQNTYAHGTTLPGVGWLVCMEGIARADLSDTSGAGQVTRTPEPSVVNPLGSAAYPFLPVTSVSDPTLTPPTNTLTQVRISVEGPASAPAQRRKKFSYEFLWNRR